MAAVENTKYEDRLQQIWSQLSVADREVILGHSRNELSEHDRTRLVRVLTRLGKTHRRVS